MNITEVRVKLMQNRSDRLRAFASITIDDDFVVHDLRVIEGRSGFFVAMQVRIEERAEGQVLRQLRCAPGRAPCDPRIPGSR